MAYSQCIPYFEIVLRANGANQIQGVLQQRVDGYRKRAEALEKYNGTALIDEHVDEAIADGPTCSEDDPFRFTQTTNVSY